MPTPAIQRIRQEIPALEGSIYMNTGGSGPLPRSVADEVAGDYQAVLEAGPDVPATREWVTAKYEACRQAVADLFGVDSEDIALMRAVSEGLSSIAFGMDWSEGDEVIINEQEHPSGISIWLNMAMRFGVKVKKLRLADTGEEFLARLDTLITDRTRLVVLSHVTTDTGHRLPAEEICRLVHDRGLRVGFDGVQAAGQFPVDLRDIDADFYSVGGNKWLLGGWGTAAMYVKRDWATELKPSWTGAYAGTWDRKTDDLEFFDNAHRFEFGGRHSAVYSGMTKGIEFVSSFGTDNVEARGRELAGRLKAAIAEVPGAELWSPETPEMSTGIVTYSVNGLAGDDLNRRMWEEWSILGRPSMDKAAMRLSVAFFNTEEEIETVIGAISTLAHRAQT